MSIENEISEILELVKNNSKKYYDIYFYDFKTNETLYNTYFTFIPRIDDRITLNMSDKTRYYKVNQVKYNINHYYNVDEILRIDVYLERID